MPEYDDGKFNQDDWLFNEQYGYYQNELPEILKDPIYGNGKRGMPIPSYLQNLSSDEVVKQAQAERQKRIDWFKQNWYSQQDKVAQLSPTDKLLEAVNRAAILLPEALAEEIKALFTPETLATMVAILGVYLAAHATGIGQAFDIGMLIAGGIYFGLDAFAIFKHLAGFANAINATSEEELDDAAEDLAWAIAKVGVDAVMTLLTKKVADEVGKGLDHLDRVNEVHAHNDPDVNAGNLDGVSKQTPNIKDHDGIQGKQNIMDRMDEIAPRSDDIIKEVINGGNIPDRAQNRINIRAGSATLSNRYRGSGLNYALSNHLNPSKAAKKSQFSISKNEIISILMNEDVIKSPVEVANKSSNRPGGLAFTREVDLAQFSYGEIGNLPQDDFSHGAPTTKITIITDGFGNLKNVFPGFMNSLDR